MPTPRGPGARSSPKAEPAKRRAARKPNSPAFASLLDAAADGVVLLDGRGLIMSANRGAGALFGYEPHELVGRAFSELFAPESVETAYDCLEG